MEEGVYQPAGMGLQGQLTKGSARQRGSMTALSCPHCASLTLTAQDAGQKACDRPALTITA